MSDQCKKLEKIDFAAQVRNIVCPVTKRKQRTAFLTVKPGQNDPFTAFFADAPDQFGKLLFFPTFAGII